MILRIALLLLCFAVHRAPAQPVPPFTDAQWLASRCRYHALQPYGPYGDNSAIRNLRACIANAQAGLIHMENQASEAAERDRFHTDADVEFVDEAGHRHVCHLLSRKNPYDRLREADSELRPFRFNAVAPELKAFLDANIAFTCEAEVS